MLFFLFFICSTLAHPHPAQVDFFDALNRLGDVLYLKNYCLNTLGRRTKALVQFKTRLILHPITPLPEGDVRRCVRETKKIEGWLENIDEFLEMEQEIDDYMRVNRALMRLIYKFKKDSNSAGEPIPRVVEEELRTLILNPLEWGVNPPPLEDLEREIQRIIGIIKTFNDWTITAVYKEKELI